MDWIKDEQHRKYHEVSSFFPLMEGKEFEQLKTDIADNGLLESIWLHPNGSIIDGRNRHRACIETETKPKFRTWNYEGSLVSFAVSLNLHRRHLTSSQWAVIALDVLPMLEKEARDRQRGGQAGILLSQKVDQANDGRAAQQAAEMFQTNRQYISDAKALQNEAPDLLEQVRSGEKTIKRAKTLLNERKNKERAAEYSEKVKSAPPLQKTYHVIYADPPWKYGPENPQGGTAGAHYATMELDDICAYLETTKLSIADNAILFLWVTNPFLKKALKVVGAWGFEYKTNIVWVKTELKKPGSGWYVRGHHELLFIATRGSFTPLDKNISPPISSVLKYPVREHSQKPDAVYDTIERLYPDCVYVELFARQKRKGWDCLGADL